jgi:GNAT superfamily N-acetyltransferase
LEDWKTQSIHSIKNSADRDMSFIRPLVPSDIPYVKDLPPQDWNIDLPQLMATHYNRPYFYPIVAEEDSNLIGCGIAMIHGNISWLGTIIVLPPFRQRGIGSAITQHLIDFCKERGCITQILTASTLGEPMYRKLGFSITEHYDVYSTTIDHAYPADASIRSCQPSDEAVIKQMDKSITGEDRSSLITQFLHTSVVYSNPRSNDIRGVYFPDFGSGLILANDDKAGLALMKYRLMQKRNAAVFPSRNQHAKQWLEQEGFRLTKSLPRMVLGEEVSWCPEKIYNRGTGYCG